MAQITNKTISLVSSLGERKHRKREGLFKAEGTKCVLDTLPHFQLRGLYATAEWAESHPGVEAEIASRGDLRKMSSLTTPTDVIAVYAIPEQPAELPDASKRLVLALDTIQDPGNLGTIIRVADWFGVRDIICTRETADCYAPKVIQATMGSISRVKLTYGDLPAMLAEMKAPGVYGMFLDGADITHAELGSCGVVVIGNEGNGISLEVARCVTHRLLIPSYPPDEPTGESLNAAIATAITLAKFRGI